MHTCPELSLIPENTLETISRTYQISVDCVVNEVPSTSVLIIRISPWAGRRLYNIVICVVYGGPAAEGPRCGKVEHLSRQYLVPPVSLISTTTPSHHTRVPGPGPTIEILPHASYTDVSQLRNTETISQQRQIATALCILVRAVIPVFRDWHDFFVTRLLDHQISSGRWQINRTQNRNNLYFLDIVHIIIVFMFFKIFVFLKYEKTYCLAHFVHGLMDMRVVDFLAKN